MRLQIDDARPGRRFGGGVMIGEAVRDRFNRRVIPHQRRGEIAIQPACQFPGNSHRLERTDAKRLERGASVDGGGIDVERGARLPTIH